MEPVRTAPDDDLLARIQGGDEQAFLAFYRLRQAAIYRYALHMCGSAAAAEDITQEVFLALIREECGFDPTRGTLSGYLFGIARKLVLRFVEKGRNDVVLDESSEENGTAEFSAYYDPLADLTRREDISALRRAVNALPRRYREVVLLCDIEEVDYADAAEILSCPIGTVRSRLHRARALLLEKLQTERSARSPLRSLKPVRCTV
jgi:RNA polymerase sigma-70 factor (ECF subfamily)